MKIKKVRVFFDSSAIPELFQKVPVGFLFTFEKGNKMATRGFLHGKLRWKKLDISTEQGSLRRGLLHFDRAKVQKNHHNVTFRISYRDTTLYTNLRLPFVQKIRFNLYTDSIKRGVPYYLNIEGTFSNGKVYPLDIESILFSGSAGEIKDNTLHFSGNDSIHHIRVRAVFKYDSCLKAEAIIPIKTYTKEVSLPSEAELLHQWKKESQN